METTANNDREPTNSTASQNQRDLNDTKTEDNSSLITKETQNLMQPVTDKETTNTPNYLISRSTTSLARCTSMLRLRQNSSGSGSNKTTSIDPALSSKLRRLNIFCTIRQRRVPRALRSISTTFRTQLNALRPSSGDPDELAARNCLLDLDDYLESISRGCASADEDELPIGAFSKRISQNDVIGGKQRTDEELVESSRSVVRRHSFREAMANSVPTVSGGASTLSKANIHDITFNCI